MTRIKIEILAGVLAVSAGLGLTALAHAESSKPSLKHERFMEKLDTDKDGKISDAERKAAHAMRFTEQDTDKNGVISRTEAVAFAQSKAAKRADRMFARLDADKDGKISRAEFDAAGEKMHKRFKKWRDRDGCRDAAKMGAPEDRPE